MNKSPFKDNHLELNEGFISMTYDLGACVCPVMKASETKNPHACQCTVGFIKGCFEKMIDQKVSVTMVSSYIKNNQPCQFEVRLG